MRHTKCFALSNKLLEIKTQEVLIMEAPHRFDLIATSYVNKEVVSFNRELQNTIKILTMLRL
jgi:uridine phosphorylase